MKFGKDEVQKIILSLLLLTGLLYCYFNLLLGPVKLARADAETKIRARVPQINEGKKQLQRTADIQKKAPAANAVLAQIKSTIPEGAPVAWFPPRMNDFFKRRGIDKSLTRLNNQAPEKDLAGFSRF